MKKMQCTNTSMICSYQKLSSGEKHAKEYGVKRQEKTRKKIDNYRKQVERIGKVTITKTMMDQAREYARNKKEPINKLERINYMRILKMHLSCKIVEKEGNKFLYNTKSEQK